MRIESDTAEIRRRFRERVEAKDVMRIMAAHSPLSARLAEEAGFDGIWASGFELSALYGLPDLSLVSMAEHAEMTRRITATTGLPVIADIDTGHGNAVNVIHSVAQYERGGAAAVVIEDKTFPKVTSLVEGGRQVLVGVEEFQGKIEAALHARIDENFLVIARTEALIAGHGQADALRRASAYVDAGADLILVHSKRSTPDEIVTFAQNWNSYTALAVVPTTYPAFTPSHAQQLGNVALYIYGNHSIRAAITGMRQTLAEIAADDNTIAVDQQIVSVEDVFRLQHMDLAKRNETRFLR